MTTMLSPLPLGSPPRMVAKTLALDVTASDDIILRVIALLRTRRVRVTSVDFATRDSAGSAGAGRFVIGMEAPVRIAHCVEAWLGGLVDVLAVESVAAGASRGDRT